MTRHDTRGLLRPDPYPELNTPSYQNMLENAQDTCTSRLEYIGVRAPLPRTRAKPSFFGQKLTFSGRSQ